MAMPDILTLTMNPALDISTAVDKVQPAHKLRCEAAQTHPGGGGINVARVIHRLGGNCLALYPAGGATGQTIHTLLNAEKVPQHLIPISQENRESFSVHDNTSGLEYRFVLPGPHLQAHEWQSCLDYVDALESAPRYIIASGSLAPGIPTDFYARLADTCHRRGCLLVVDSSGPALQAAVKAGVYLFKPSLRELQELTGQELATDTQKRQASRDLIHSGQAQVVALSLGEAGAMLTSGHESWQAKSLSVAVASTVGAGDSFLGGLVWSLSRGHAMADSFRYAMASASAALLSPGTALCQPQDVERLHHQVTITPC